MRGWWDAAALDELFARALRQRIHKHINQWGALKLFVRAWLSNPQRPEKAFDVGFAHYDQGNDLFEAMLDSNLVYSCGYWNGTDDLDIAQEQKLDLVCRKLGLRRGQRLLDIGCGWGSLCRHAVEHYGVSAVGITISREQLALASERARGLPIEIRLQDYREIDEPFDHVASIGMIEHVGEKNYRRFFEVVRRCLKADGLLLLHTIGGNLSTRVTDPWIERYIFPNGHLPSIRQLSGACEGLFVVEDLHNFGSDYDRTLMAWFRNFEQAWPTLSESYDETFYRMWKYYLLSCAGRFAPATSSSFSSSCLRVDFPEATRGLPTDRRIQLAFILPVRYWR